MSAAPPSMPPGGAPPPYDPKTQWRVYREQQRAAWRAQRDAWRAQRHALKYANRSAYGPRVPSLVGPIVLLAIGIVWLLVGLGYISGYSFWGWYAQWWPLILIVAGLAMLAEWYIDMRRKTPVRRSGGFIALLVLLAIVGLSVSGARGSINWMRMNFGDNDFFNHWGMPEHDFDLQGFNSPVPANATISIDDPRGDVSLAAGDGPNLQVQAHAVAYANSDQDAKKIFDAIAPHFSVNGNTVSVQAQGNENGRLNLTVTVPKSAHLSVNAGHGDVSATGMGSGISITVPHGDTRLSAITGPVQMHFSGGKNDFSAHQIQGDLTLDGNSNNLTFSDIQGRIHVNGEILGEVHMANISAPISIHTSVTDLQVASLPGELTLDNDDLRVIEAKGAVHVVTHDKDVSLSQIYGDTFVQDSTGDVSVAPAGVYSVQASNSKGDVELTLPPNAAGTVDGRTQNGDIVSDYALAISGDENKTVTGKIGAGGPKIVLSSENGDLRIRKGSPVPPTPPTPPAPGAPNSSRVPHLRAPTSQPVEPVTQ
ncbi:MAG TPA: DUF4097 family beta strand repeat-containing protein [Terracidiphilus sp.]|nr:DUF4097 family beta strand repeat-containing protein [Terracidiphilus sp.]